MQFYTVDAFASRPFEGNPAAVVPLYQSLTDKQMQDLAMEMNLSETAYMVPETTCTDEDAFRTATKFHLRWFTPKAEVFFCGHATLATAHVLFHEIGNKSDCLEFRTLAGLLKIRRDDEHIVMDFPVYEAKAPPSDILPSMMQVAAAAAGGKKIQQVLLETNNSYLLVQLEDMNREEFKDLVPSMSELKEYTGNDVKLVAITTRGTKGLDFLARCFAPWLGLPEDPVTGSSYTVLTPFWAKKLNKTQMKCRQASARGGDITVKLQGDRVLLLAQALTFLKGEVTVF